MTTRSSLSRIAVLAAGGTPLLCVDTCGLLDLQRGLLRDDVSAASRRQGLQLVTDIEAGRVISIITDQVATEFAKNRALVVADAAKALAGLADQLAKAELVAEVFGVTPIQPDLSHLDAHAGQAEAIVDRWLEVSHQIDERPELLRRAAIRINLARTPAKQGKQNFKDCLITETFLDLITDMRNSGISSKAVFLSSNTDDYAEGKGSSRMKIDLLQEFDAIQLDYAVNAGQARHTLGV